MDQAHEVGSDDAQASQDHAASTVKGRQELSVHPVAAMFPEMPEESKRYRDLRASIRRNGQFQPVVIDDEGRILDGRHRLRACRDLGIEPKIVTLSDLRLGLNDEGQPIYPDEYAFASNASRRDLTDDQRAQLHALYRDWLKGQRNKGGQPGNTNASKTKVANSSPSSSRPDASRGKTRAKLAEQAGVSEHKARQALDLARADPERAKRVAAGEIKLLDASAAVAKVATKPKVSHKDRFNPVEIQKRATDAARRAAVAVRTVMRECGITGEVIREAFASELVKKLAPHLRLSVTHQPVTDRGQPEKKESAGPLH